jgi:hypothetical protein
MSPEQFARAAKAIQHQLDRLEARFERRLNDWLLRALRTALSASRARRAGGRPYTGKAARGALQAVQAGPGAAIME